LSIQLWIFINGNIKGNGYIKIHYSKNKKGELIAIYKNIKVLTRYTKSNLIDLIMKNSTDDEKCKIFKPILVELFK